MLKFVVKRQNCE